MNIDVQRVGEAAIARCIEIRTDVFVRGQGVPLELEVDGLDPDCTHFLARCAGRDVGTARLRFLADAGKAERVAVLETHRGAGVGEALMRAVEEEARQAGRRRMILHAQVRVIPFYEKLGYVAEGEEFMDADIPHRSMRKEIP